MAEIIKYENSNLGCSLRTVDINGKPYLIGRDVALALGYANPPKAVRDHVSDKNKTTSEEVTINGTMATLVNESGLYQLIMKSKMKEAEQFQEWVCDEVLPSLRKNGAYIVGQESLSKKEMDEMRSMLRDMRDMLGLSKQRIAEQEATIADQEETIEEQAKEIAENAPKVEFAEQLLGSGKEMSLTNFAKIASSNGYNMNQRTVYKYLRDRGFLNHRNRPESRYMDEKRNANYFVLRFKSINGKTVMVPMVTVPGIQFLLNDMSKHYKAQGKALAC